MTRAGTFFLYILLGAFGPHIVCCQSPKEDSGVNLSEILTQQIDSIYKTLYYDDYEAALAALKRVEQKAEEAALVEVQLSARLNMHYCAQYHGKVDTMVHYLEAARSLFNEARHSVPLHVRDKLDQKILYANGNAAYQFGEYDQAIASFEKILAFDSLKPVYLYKCLSYIGHSYSNLDNYPQAIDYHFQALEQLPADDKYHYYRGLSYSYLGISFKKMYELKLDTAMLRKALKHYRVSLSYFTKSNSKNTTGPIGCYTLLSEAYGLLDQPDSSTYYLRKAQLLDPEHTETLRFWGMHYNRIGNFEKARQSFLESNVIIARNKGPGHYLLGRNLTQIGKQYEAENRWKEAIRHYQQAF